MIFVTVGGEKYPFSRLVKTIDEAVASGLLDVPVFGQIGTSIYLPSKFPYSRFLSFPDLMDNIKRAGMVITHAGVGTVILALSQGKIPIVFPRRAELGEHVDDHQVELARKLERVGRVLLAEAGEDLFDRIREYDALIASLPATTGRYKEILIENLHRIVDPKAERV